MGGLWWNYTHNLTRNFHHIEKQKEIFFQKFWSFLSSVSHSIFCLQWTLEVRQVNIRFNVHFRFRFSLPFHVPNKWPCSHTHTHTAKHWELKAILFNWITVWWLCEFKYTDTHSHFYIKKEAYITYVFPTILPFAITINPTQYTTSTRSHTYTYTYKLFLRNRE